jgi:alkylhydroperoxidase family enzyme
MRTFAIALLGLAAASAGAARAEEPPAATPRPVPLTRPEVKQYLEDMKARKPRIPLPELTEEEKGKIGDRADNYEARLRYHYLPEGDGRGAFGFSREPDPVMTLDYPFKTELFWIVSRTNNCQYCLGHQEMKLAVAGRKEEEIAALDGDWSEQTPARRAAFAFARKLTYEPHRLGDADIDGLRKHYTDLQILEMVLSVAGNNAINRWKEGVGVPQSRELSGFLRQSGAAADVGRALPTKSFLTPTPEKYRDAITRVAPLRVDETSHKPSRLAVCERPPLESRADVEKALEACRKRAPRLPLVDGAKARALLPDDWPRGDLPQWVRLLANFPRDGKSRIVSQRTADEKGDLQPLLKARVSWIIARQDRAWYAAGEARGRLKNMGQSEEQICGLDGDWADFPPAERALFTVARKLAASPVVLTDDDVARAVKLAGARDVVQLISYTTNRASFDRITEAAGLRLEK